MKRIIKYFITRRTKHENYKIAKQKRPNGQKYYTVKFKEWFVGWHEVQEDYNSTTTMDKIFDIKDDAKAFIETEITNAYKELTRLR